MTIQRSMTKTRTRKSKKKGVVRRRVSVPTARGMPRVDALAARYAQLLMNPCEAALVHPVYGGSDGAYLIRLTSTQTFGAGSAFALQWTPGAVGGLADASSDVSLLVREASAFATPGTITAVANSVVTGGKWLRANASSSRCVAACAQVFYTGAESARAGLLYFGHANGSVLGEPYRQASSISCANVAAGCPSALKTPAAQLELVWKPSLNDSLWHETDVEASAELLSRKGSIILAGQALPSAITVRFTAVYEYMPDVISSEGITFPQQGTASSSTLRDVLSYISGAYQNPWVRGMVNNAVAGLVGYMAPNQQRMGGPYGQRYLRDEL